MAESDISISEMTNGTFSAGAIFPAIQPDGQSSTGYSNVKLSGSDIGDGIGQLQFPLRLDTNNKTIFGAINEAANAYVNILPTDTATGSIASFPDGANGIPLQSLILNVKPYQAGTGDPSPNNERPISGWTQAVITRTGANLWDEISEIGNINNTTGQNQDYGTNRIRSKNYIPVYPALNIYVINNNTVPIYLYCYRRDLSYIDLYSSSGITGTATITIPSDCYYIRFRSNDNYGDTTEKISFNYPSTNTSYHAYTAETRTAEFGQIIYGATINPLTGEGTNQKYKLSDFTDINVAPNVLGDTVNTFYLDTTIYRARDTYVISNKFKTSPLDSTTPYKCEASASQSTNIYRRIYFSLPATITTGADAKQWLIDNGVEFVYNLETPPPITITPIENISTLYGTNNIFQDAGDTTATYKADIGLYIDKKTS